MNQVQVRKFREDNFKGKDSRKQWSIISGVSVRSIRHYESGTSPIPQWYPMHIIFYKKAYNINDK